MAGKDALPPESIEEAMAAAHSTWTPEGEQAPDAPGAGLGRVGHAQQLVGLSVRNSPAAMRRASLIVR